LSSDIKIINSRSTCKEDYTMKQGSRIKLKMTFFKRETIREILHLENGSEYVIFLVLLLSRTINQKTFQRFFDGVSFDASELSKITKMEISTVRTAINIFEAAGLFEELEDLELELPFP
jgi:hypothetical protein